MVVTCVGKDLTLAVTGGRVCATGDVGGAGDGAAGDGDGAAGDGDGAAGV